jgi:predicted  nucleic acid-binding Zn-ribbon protein
MPGPAAILRELHRLRKHAADLQGELDRGPLRLKAQEAKLAKQEEAYRLAHEAVKHLKVAIHEKEVSLKAKHQLLAKREKQLDEASGKEYEALQREIQHEKEACSRLEDEILAALAEVESKTAQLPEIERIAKKAREEHAQFVLDVQAKRHQVMEMLADVHRQLTEVEEKLADDERAAYNRLVASMGADAMASVVGRSCQACYTEITVAMLQNLQQERFVACKSCGRLLYLAASPSPPADD